MSAGDCKAPGNFACWRDPFKFSTDPQAVVMHLETKSGAYSVVVDSLDQPDDHLLWVLQMQLDAIRKKLAQPAPEEDS